MAQVEVTVIAAYLCEHCKKIVLPVEAMYRDGPRLVIRHECFDGFVQDRFEHSVGLTRMRIV